MKFVVTGATGFIGSALCAKLTGAGHTVAALVRDAERAKQKLGPNVEAIAWKPQEGGTGDTAIAEADVIINLAGASVSAQRWTNEFKLEILSSRTVTTRAIVDVIERAEHKPTALISASAVGYYGDCKDATVTEETPPAEDFLGEACRAWEAETRRAADFGVREARMRIGIVLGHGGALEKMLRPLPIPLSPWKFGLGGPLGSGRQWMPWVHLADTVGLFVWAATNPQVAGPVNTTAPNPVTNAEFAHAMGRVLHRPAILPVPGFALKLMLGEFADSVLGGQKAFPTAAERLGYPFEYRDIDAALRSLL